MFCSYCGANIPDSSAGFCPQCGAAVQSVPQAGQPRPVAPAAAPAPAYSQPQVPVAQPYLGQPQTEGKAVGSLILGICSWIGLWLLAGIPAIILGHLAKSSIRQSMGRLKGDGIATTGLVLGYLSVAAVPMILIIAAIAIPSLLRAKMSANASAAASTIRAVNTAQTTYKETFAAKGYAPSLAVLGPGSPQVSCSSSSSDSEHACYLDNTLGCGSTVWCIKNGYRFNLTGICGADGACTGYVTTATPVSDATGTRSFCSTDDLLIRYHTGRPLDSPLATAEECQSWPPVL